MKCRRGFYLGCVAVNELVVVANGSGNSEVGGHGGILWRVKLEEYIWAENKAMVQMYIIPWWNW